MVDLIEAAATGALGEEVFEECLVVNDKLTNVLGDLEKDAKDRMPLTSAASIPASNNDVGVEEEPEVDIDLSGNLDNMNLKSEEGGDSGNDPFSGGTDLLTPTPVENEDPFSILDGGDSKPPAVGAKVEEEDDFDAFFKDRTSAPGSNKED